MTRGTERVVVLVVLVVWALTILAPAVRPAFHAVPEVHIALMAVIALIKANPNKPTDDKEPLP